ncbi:MAG TPA: DNA recombination protein RmuC [Acidimicrobiales bacterium]|nr:DNA recombination protein RmuC [Acidimicrobiales bacterium]
MISGLIIGLLVGVVAGVVVGLLVRSGHVARTRTAEARLADAVAANRRLTEEHAAQQQLRATAQAETARLSAQLEHERTINHERAAGFEETRQQLTGEFARLSGEALRRNNEQFLQLADSKLNETRQAAEGELGKRQEAIEQLLKPIGEQLGKYDDGMRRLEVERQRAYTTLTEQMQQLSTSHDHLQKETRSLVTALRAPQTRGRWGELQLRRVVEMAGMLERCDFDEQVTSNTDQGRLRPDMVVHLPGGKNVAVDAKVPMQAFLDANEAEDETTRRMHLANHGRQLKAHVDSLAKKEYWKQVDPSPEFVVAFVPGDPLLTTALEHVPGLMEHAVANHVLLATPTSLIALLRAVAYGWQQDAMAESAREVQQLGAELYQRLSVLGDHFAGVGKGLNGAVAAYNKAVGSLEGRVLVTARRFADMGVIGTGEKDIAPSITVDAAPRALQSPELGGQALRQLPPIDPMEALDDEDDAHERRAV